jgi:hypothetical protein
MTNRILPITAVSAIFASLLWASPAGAATISIGVSQTDSGFATIGSGSGIATASGQSLGSFSNIDVVALGNPVLSLPTLLDSDTLNVAGSTGKLWIAVTSQGLTSPLSLSNFTSSFTTNAISPGWTVTESTFVNPNDGLYAQVTPLGSASFNSINTSSKDVTANPGTDFSVTELYEISAVGAGVSNDTIDLSGRQAPIPPTLPLFVGGLGLLGFAGWFKRRKEETSAIKFLAD